MIGAQENIITLSEIHSADSKKNSKDWFLLFGLMITVVCHVEVNGTILEVRGKYIWWLKRVDFIGQKKRGRGGRKKETAKTEYCVHILFCHITGLGYSKYFRNSLV